MKKIKNKLILLINLILLANISYAQETCDNLMNSEYNFSYTISDNLFSYEITKKDNKEIYFYTNSSYNFPGEIGINFLNDKKSIVYAKDLDIIYRKYANFFYEGGRFYSSNMFSENLSQHLILPLSSNSFERKKIIKQSINLDNFVNFLRPKLNNEQQYGIQEFRIKIKFLLDSNVNSCLIYSTNTIKYDFIDETSKLYILKNKIKHIYQMIIE